MTMFLISSQNFAPIMGGPRAKHRLLQRAQVIHLKLLPAMGVIVLGEVHCGDFVALT